MANLSLSKLAPKSTSNGSRLRPFALVAVTALVSAFSCGGDSQSADNTVSQTPFNSDVLSSQGDDADSNTEMSQNGTEQTQDSTSTEGDGSTTDVERANENATDEMLALDSSDTTAGNGSEDSTEDTTAEDTTEDVVAPDLVTTGYPEHTGADCDVSAGQLQRNVDLPDPFAMNDGTRVATVEDWTCRRAEIRKDIEQYEIGVKPEPPQVQANLAGGSLNVTVTTDAGTLNLTSNVGTPGGDGPNCVVIGMNNNSNLVNGCIQVPFSHDQVVTYSQGSNQSQNDPFYSVYPELFGQIGNYSAWSWGISRIIDGLDQVKDDLNIDMSKIAVHGCSYAGKMALFAGAFDERVALTIAQESGGGGINSWRLSQDFTTRTGTNIEKIDNTNYSWFKGSMQQLDEYSLPHDHHELVAMVAPRAIVTLGNPPYEWLGDESGFKSYTAAREVWAAMGVEDRIGYDFASGHNHCATTAGQAGTVTSFVDRFLKDQDVDTNITLAPTGTNFDLSSAVNWETPTLQ